MKIEINKLQPHPLNTMIYGHEDNTVLLEKIKSSGWIKPVLITRNFTIISGHRRVEVCKLLGITEIEYEIIGEEDPVKIMEIILAENAYRVKTNIQLLKEAEYYRDVEKKKAYQRQIEAEKIEKGHDLLEIFPEGRDSDRSPLVEKGNTRDIVGAKIGMSGRSYDKGRKVLQRIEGEEDPMVKWLFENTANQSIDNAAKLTEKPVGFIQSVIDRTGWDKDKIPSAIREVELEEMKQKSNLPPGKYQIIYIDLTGKNIDKLYQTSIAGICEDDCVLFFWVKTHQLKEGIKICEQWGFKYASCLVWNRDVLNEVSENGEILLVYLKGRPKVIFDTYEGSEPKPLMVKEIIEKGYPGWSKVEIFAGESIEGWEIW